MSPTYIVALLALPGVSGCSASLQFFDEGASGINLDGGEGTEDGGSTDLSGPVEGDGDHPGDAHRRVAFVVHFEPGRVPDASCLTSDGRPCKVEDGFKYPTNGYAGPSVGDSGARSPSTEWPAEYWPDLVSLVERMDEEGFKLTLHFQAQWAEYVLSDPLNDDSGCSRTKGRKNLIRCWLESGHEIGMHHHTLHVVCDPNAGSGGADPAVSMYQGSCGAAFSYPEDLQTDAGVILGNSQYNGDFWGGYTQLPASLKLPWLKNHGTDMLFDTGYRNWSFPLASGAAWNPASPRPQWDPSGWRPDLWHSISDDSHYLGSPSDHVALIESMMSGATQQEGGRVLSASIGPGWEASFEKNGGSLIDFPLGSRIKYITNNPHYPTDSSEMIASDGNGGLSKYKKNSDSKYNPRGERNACSWYLGHAMISDATLSELEARADDQSERWVAGLVMHVFNFRNPQYQARVDELIALVNEKNLAIDTISAIQSAFLGHSDRPLNSECTSD